jgi:hypothetical protein
VNIERSTLGKKKRNLMFHPRNKRSVFDSSLEMLRGMSRYKFHVHNGMSYMLLEPDKYVLDSVIGEFIFTKMRSKVIHTTVKPRRGSKKGKQRVSKKLRKKRYFAGLSNKRARLKEKPRIRLAV